MTEKSILFTIKQYEILEKIGEGGFGVVYRGHDPMLDRDVAIKVLKAEVSTSPDFVERFRREARLGASLRHPNIARIIEVGKHEGYYYLVMDFYSGGPLSNLLKEGKQLPLAKVLNLLKPIAKALDHAHSKQIIHRDVKPSNILLDAEGQPILTDFGLVKSLTEESSTTTGIAIGTVKYMAPEQIQGKKPSSTYDNYALGIITYQMLTGQVPFTDTTTFEVQRKHVEQPPPDPHSLNPDLPHEVVNTLLKALEKDPQKRFSSASEFVSALASVVDNVTKEQYQDLIEEAYHLMDNMEFKAAIDIFEKILSIQVSPEVEDSLNECKRRKKIKENIEELKEKQSKISSQIKEITVSEKWLRPLRRGIFHFRNRDLSIHARWSWVFVGLGILWFALIPFIDLQIGQFTINQLYNKQDHAGEWLEIASRVIVWVTMCFTLGILIWKGWKKRQIPYIAVLIFCIGFSIIMPLGAWTGKLTYKLLLSDKYLTGEISRWVSPVIVWLMGLMIIALLMKKFWNTPDQIWQAIKKQIDKRGNL